MKFTRISLALLTGAALVSCTASQQQWGLGGAAAGAAAGAILGDDSDDIVRGAVIGGGAGVGAAAYKENQEKQSGAYNTGGETTPTAPAPTPAKVPVATPTNTPGIVVSPFKPHNKVNVTGFKSGTKARDPYTKGIFLVP